jgi:hypothetical protein
MSRELDKQFRRIRCLVVSRETVSLFFTRNCFSAQSTFAAENRAGSCDLSAENGQEPVFEFDLGHTSDPTQGGH